MGLDCYIVHGNDRDKAFTSEDAEELKDCNFQSLPIRLSSLLNLLCRFLIISNLKRSLSFLYK